MIAAKGNSSGPAEALDHYWSQIKEYEPLTHAQECALVKRARDGDEGAREELVLANLRFVVRVARQYVRPGGPQLMDLVSEGNAGLLEAAERFDEDRGFKFITYAVWWIRQRIFKTLSTYGRISGPPSSQLNDLQKLEEAAGQLMQLLDRDPTVEELSERAQMSRRRVRNALEARQSDLSLDAPAFSDGDNDSHEILEAQLPAADSLIETEAVKVTLGKCLQLLDQRECRIVDSYFGFTDGEPKTLEEIGGEIGLTRERVRQLRNRALDKMRDAYGDLLMEMCNN